MTAWERREGLKRVFVDGGSCFDPISGSTAAQDTLQTVRSTTTIERDRPVAVINSGTERSLGCDLHTPIT